MTTTVTFQDRQLWMLVFMSLSSFCTGCRDSEAVKTINCQHFEVVQNSDREDLRPPIIRSPEPLQDKNSDIPVDVIVKFLKLLDQGEYDAAEEMCSPYDWRDYIDGHVSDPFRSSTIKQEKFSDFCNTFREKVEKIFLSSATVKQKSGYWSIRYIAESSNHSAGGLIYFHQEDNVWKIGEQPYWLDTVQEDIDIPRL